MQQKNIIIISCIVFALILIGGGFFLFTRSNSTASQASKTTPEEQVFTMKPEEIGLALTQITYTKKNPSGPGVRLIADKLSGVAKMDVQITYTHISDTGDSLDDGLESEITVTSGQSVSQDYPFGTCSDVCHFHKSITAIKGVVKVTKNDGKVYIINVTAQ